MKIKDEEESILYTLNENTLTLEVEKEKMFFKNN